MAIVRKCTIIGFISLFLCVILSRCYVNCLQCLSQNNQPVDWYIAYKLSFQQKNVPHDSFFYMDANSTGWKFSDKTMKVKGQAVYNTLDQIYRSSIANASFTDSDLMYMMYNDQPPSLAGPSLKTADIQKGHTKGVIGFDSKRGFWLVHSTPHFPPKRTSGYSLQDHTWAQNFMCISMETDQHLDQIGIQMLYNYPYIYDQNLPKYFESKFPNLRNAMKGKHVTQDKIYKEIKIKSLNGVSFRSFAKSTYFNQDLYKDLLAPQLKSSLLVQSWQRGQGGKMYSNCTGKYKVLNIESMAFIQYKVEFKSTTDHAKWTVTNSTSNMWTCIGDINRMESQKKRGGGAVCLQNKKVWENFHSLIKSYHPCGQ